MYGVDEKKRYPGLQEEFFNRAVDPISRRESLNAFVALSECCVSVSLTCLTLMHHMPRMVPSGSGSTLDDN